MKTDERIDGFVTEIWAWYARHKRTLPWRDLDIPDDTQRAYMVLVSEIMLQQTQVPRVIIIFKRFLEQFPTLPDLAKATNAEVIQAWKGMGYNSRALRLRDAAKIIMDAHDGIFPQEMSELLSIKGIGPYTAAAVRNFAFNMPTPCIDTNIRRILHRTFVGPENAEGEWAMGDRELLKIAENVLDAAVIKAPAFAQATVGKKTYKLKPASDWHAALMDFGSLVHTKSNPKWTICPLTERGLMKAIPKDYKGRTPTLTPTRIEPGRMMGAKYIPNRIFRGRIVDALREHPKGLTFDQIGAEICTDWGGEHVEWLMGILDKLIKNNLIHKNDTQFMLGT